MLSRKKNSAGEGRNRAPLGDISNVVKVRGVVDAAVDGKQITRPITRSLCAQLLANAQAHDQHKKPVLVNLENIQKPRHQKKVVVPKQPKPEDVIVISPGTTVGAKEKSQAVAPGSLRKNKVQTLSSVLPARIKFACGVIDKNVAPKEVIEDIDEADADDEFTGAEYVEGIYTYYKLAQGL